MGAFLKREVPAASPGSANGSEAGGAQAAAPLEGDAIVDLDQLHEVGTFAQVHSIHTGDDRGESAMLLLVGHRRLKRTGMVRSNYLCPPSPLSISSHTRPYAVIASQSLFMH